MTSVLRFDKLNADWNAEPNAPEPDVERLGDTIVLRFYLNHFLYPDFAEEEVGSLTFHGCCRWRLGPTNDEGWYMGQYRYSRVAPEWGEFYEIIGEDVARDIPTDWWRLGPDIPIIRHFLFYLRDGTFECMAKDWKFERDAADTLRRAERIQSRIATK